MFVVLRVFLIFLLVALLAGGIAMLGNQLGRKIGRKKMTVFGLRPRHTSIFITSLTGSLIAVLTLALAMILSQDVREAVLGVQSRLAKLQKRETQLLKRVQELADEIRRGTIIWKYEERITLNTIPAHADERAVKNIIGASLLQANYLSITKNNKLSIEQGEEPLSLDTVLVKYSAEDSRRWVKDYTNLDKPVGLWIVSTENCLLRDPVPVTVASFPVDLLYPKGAIVYQKEILTSEVLLDWHIFLEELKTAALRRGMIEINDSLGAEISGETLKQISHTVDTHDGKILVKAVANRDLYKSSKLDVSIEVEPVRD